MDYLKEPRKNSLSYLSKMSGNLANRFDHLHLSSNERPDLFPNPVLKTSSSNDRT